MKTSTRVFLALLAVVLLGAYPAAAANVGQEVAEHTVNCQRPSA